MKIEHLLARHLYSAKTLTLQGIGTFTLPQDFVLPAENDKINEIPQGSINFTQNIHAGEDAALIDFIVQHSRKMRALASSDLESFLSLGTQFLNIGKPLKLEGIGILEKNQLGEFQFTQFGQIVTARAEEAPVQIKEKRDESFSFNNTEPNTKNTSKKMIAALLGLVILGGVGFGVWYLFMRNKPASETAQQTVTPPFIPTTDTVVKKDSLPITQKPDSITVNTQAPTTGAYTFKVVIKNYPSLAVAQKRYDKLSSYGHKLILYTNDSVTFKVAMPLNLPISDTAYAVDSVRKKLFGGNPYIELQ